MSREQPCPGRIIDDFGSGFAMGCLGGSIFFFCRGMWRGVKGHRLASGLSLMRQRAPILGGSFAMWAGIFSTIDCFFIGIRQKEDWTNQIIAGALTGGILAVRSGWAQAGRSAIAGGIILSCICLAEHVMTNMHSREEINTNLRMAEMEVQRHRKEIAKFRPDLFDKRGSLYVPKSTTARLG